MFLNQFYLYVDKSQQNNIFQNIISIFKNKLFHNKSLQKINFANFPKLQVILRQFENNFIKCI